MLHCVRQSPGMEGEDMNVSLKSLIGKLNDTCRGALEAAAGLCLTRTHYDVDVEHLLLKLSEVVDTDSSVSCGTTRWRRPVWRAT